MHPVDNEKWNVKLSPMKMNEASLFYERCTFERRIVNWINAKTKYQFTDWLDHKAIMIRKFDHVLSKKKSLARNTIESTLWISCTFHNIIRLFFFFVATKTTNSFNIFRISCSKQWNAHSQSYFSNIFFWFRECLGSNG